MNFFILFLFIKLTKQEDYIKIYSNAAAIYASNDYENSVSIIYSNKYDFFSVEILG